MRFLVVDDEILALQGMSRILSRIYPEAEIISALDSVTARQVFDTDVDVAFLDIDMPGMNGLELGRKLLQKKENLNIIFVTAYSKYALDAYQLHASGYLTKPIEMKKLMAEMEHLRYPLENPVVRLKVRCFGNFEAFHNGTPIHFSRSSSKEVLAYLIDRRGASVTIDEMCTSFWEDTSEIEKKKSYIRTMIKALRKTLEENGLQDVLVSQRNSYAINPSLVECDYYQLLDKPEKNKLLFQGEYMSQYSWAERTLGNLNNLMWV